MWSWLFYFGLMWKLGASTLYEALPICSRMNPIQSKQFPYCLVLMLLMWCLLKICNWGGRVSFWDVLFYNNFGVCLETVWCLSFFFFFFFWWGNIWNFNHLKLSYNREIQLRGHNSKKKKQTAATSHIPLKLHASQARTHTNPNPGDTRETTSSCYFMGSPVATPFQMLKGTPGKGGRDIFNVLNNVSLITAKIVTRDSLNNWKSIRFHKDMGDS